MKVRTKEEDEGRRQSDDEGSRRAYLQLYTWRWRPATATSAEIPQGALCAGVVVAAAKERSDKRPRSGEKGRRAGADGLRETKMNASGPS